MKEYIERALAVQELEVLRQEYEMHDDCDELVARRCREAISALPAADVVEVVRCDCCERRYEEDGEYFCSRTDMPCADDDFCSHGARMDKEGEHEQ